VAVAEAAVVAAAVVADVALAAVAVAELRWAPAALPGAPAAIARTDHLPALVDARIMAGFDRVDPANEFFICCAIRGARHPALRLMAALAYRPIEKQHFADWTSEVSWIERTSCTHEPAWCASFVC